MIVWHRYGKKFKASCRSPPRRPQRQPLHSAVAKYDFRVVTQLIATTIFSPPGRVVSGNTSVPSPEQIAEAILSPDAVRELKTIFEPSFVISLTEKKGLKYGLKPPALGLAASAGSTCSPFEGDQRTGRRSLYVGVPCTM